MAESSNQPFADLALRGEVSANLTGFCRLLRQEGVGVGPGEQVDALRALEAIDIGQPALFRAALRTALAKSPEEHELFDQLYGRYWLVWDRAGELNRQMREKTVDAAPTATEPAAKPATVTISDWLKNSDRIEGEEEAAGYSPFEVTTQRDFKGFTTAELPEIIKLINELSRTLATRFSRRYQQSRRRGKLDLRHTLRLSLRRGGDLIDLAYRRRRLQKLKLVLLCDVSKSMDLYSRFLIQFIFGFQTAYRRIESFAFSTSLHHISPLMKTDNLGEVLEQVRRSVPGLVRRYPDRALHSQFADGYGQLVDRNTVVLIISDGWDTGDIGVLESSMDQIQRRCRSLIWLNPLMGHPDYAPTCRGMQAALPYVDLLASAHNLDSLRRLVRQLGKLHRGQMSFGHRRWYVKVAPPIDPESVPVGKVVSPVGQATDKVDKVAGLERFGKRT